MPCKATFINSGEIDPPWGVPLSVPVGTTRQWMLDADIEGAFDNISHEHLIKVLGSFPGRRWIKRWLAAGIMEQGKWSGTVRYTRRIASWVLLPGLNP